MSKGLRTVVDDDSARSKKKATGFVDGVTMVRVRACVRVYARTIRL